VQVFLAVPVEVAAQRAVLHSAVLEILHQLVHHRVIMAVLLLVKLTLMAVAVVEVPVPLVQMELD
jgi:hypothetical protein